MLILHFVCSWGAQGKQCRVIKVTGPDHPTRGRSQQIMGIVTWRLSWLAQPPFAGVSVLWLLAVLKTENCYGRMGVENGKNGKGSGQVNRLILHDHQWSICKYSAALHRKAIRLPSIPKYSWSACLPPCEALPNIYNLVVLAISRLQAEYLPERKNGQPNRQGGKSGRCPLQGKILHFPWMG